MKKVLIALSIVLAIGGIVAGLYISSDYSFSFIETYKKNFSDNLLNLKIRYEMKKAEKEEQELLAQEEEIINEEIPTGENITEDVPIEEPLENEKTQSKPDVEPIRVSYTDLPKKFVTTGEPIALTAAASARFENYQENILCVVENSIVLYNKKGKILWNVPVQIANPILRVEGEYILLMEQNGNKVALYKGKKQQFQIETKEKILTGNLSSNGDCAILTEKMYYKGAVEVYNRSGLEIYSRSFGKNNAISVAISDARRLCVSLLSTENGVSSHIVYLDLDKTKEDVTVNYDDCVIFDLDFVGNTLHTFADNQLIALNNNGREIWRRDYPDKTLKLYCDDKENTRLMLFDGNNNAEISVINSSGREKRKITEDIVPDFCDISNGYILYNGGRSLYLTKLNGTPLAKYVASRDMKKAYFIDSDNILVVYSQSIEFLHIENGE